MTSRESAFRLVVPAGFGLHFCNNAKSHAKAGPPPSPILAARPGPAGSALLAPG